VVRRAVSNLRNQAASVVLDVVEFDFRFSTSFLLDRRQRRVVTAAIAKRWRAKKWKNAVR
jgi:hypothetical protein